MRIDVDLRDEGRELLCVKWSPGGVRQGGGEEEEEKEEAEGALVGMGAVSVVMDIWCYLLNFEAAAGPEAAMGRPSER